LYFSLTSFKFCSVYITPSNYGMITFNVLFSIL